MPGRRDMWEAWVTWGKCGRHDMGWWGRRWGRGGFVVSRRWRVRHGNMVLPNIQLELNGAIMAACNVHMAVTVIVTANLREHGKYGPVGLPLVLLHSV